MNNNNIPIQRNITYNADNHTLFTVESISELQTEINKKLSLYINKEYQNKRNDLGLCLQGEKQYLRLVEYVKMLEELKYCNTCFECWHPSEIISAIYQNINKLF